MKIKPGSLRDQYDFDRARFLEDVRLWATQRYGRECGAITQAAREMGLPRDALYNRKGHKILSLVNATVIALHTDLDLTAYIIHKEPQNGSSQLRQTRQRDSGAHQSTANC